MQQLAFIWTDIREVLKCVDQIQVGLDRNKKLSRWTLDLSIRAGKSRLTPRNEENAQG
jgi:hypothetical protein